jgi:hypothetical protein
MSPGGAAKLVDCILVTAGSSSVAAYRCSLGAVLGGKPAADWPSMAVRFGEVLR